MKRRIQQNGEKNMNTHIMNNKYVYEYNDSVYDHHIRALRDIYSSDKNVRMMDRQSTKSKTHLTNMFYTKAKNFQTTGIYIR